MSTSRGQVYDVLAQYRPDGVVHLAANPSPTGHTRVNVFDNLVSAHNVLQAAGDLGISRVDYASSEMVTGLQTEGVVAARIPFDEPERRPSPNPYALGKYVSEVVVDSLVLASPATAWVGLRINDVIDPDGYERFRDEWADPSLSSVNFWSYIDARRYGVPRRARGQEHRARGVPHRRRRHAAKRGLRDLMAESYGGFDQFADDYEDPRSAFGCGTIKALFAWTPTCSWRGHPRREPTGRDQP